MAKIDLFPKTCNLCMGPVIYTSNAEIYGRAYGSGKCYICLKCGAYVGTHKPRPREALGLLADREMRNKKILCHEIFDSFWQGKPKSHKKREDLYRWLSGQMRIPFSECHFGWFNNSELDVAFKILSQVRGKQMKYTDLGTLYFE